MPEWWVTQRAWIKQRILAIWERRQKKEKVQKGNGRMPKTNLDYFRIAP